MMFGEYFDYITKLGIYCKLYDKQVSLSRDDERGKSEEIFIATSNYGDFRKEGSNFEDFMMQNQERMQKSQSTVFSNNEFSLLDGQKEKSPPTLEELRKAILERFSTMDANEIANSQISQYEYRKIIGMQYQDIDLSQEDIKALNLYKHGMFDFINGFLRGDLSCINEKKLSEETFVRDYISEVLDCIGRISEIQKKFISTKDMTLVRRDARINENMEEQLEYDNFVSTSANPRLFTYALDGIKGGGFLFIKVPKGTPVIPMDIVTEKKMSLRDSVSEWGGGDIGYEESEMLMPMCDIEINEHQQLQNGKTMANATMVRQKNPVEIMEKRLEEISSMIVQYGGQEKLEELRAKVQAIKSQYEKGSQFSEQETPQFSSAYSTIDKVYTEINKNGINAYMFGGISSAIQAGIDLYRQNEDIDLMVAKEDLPQLIESLRKIGYKVEDKRGQLTENYVDAEGTFHPADHELNADINSPDMLGVGIFVFERKDGTVITNSYAYEEKAQAVIGNQSVMPEELFDLMYSSEEIEYKGTPVKCQSKEFTYLSKSSGNREKDKLDASVIEQYIGEDEQKKIDRIRKLQKRIVRYRNTYDKDGNIISSEKVPGMEDKIANFIGGIVAQNAGLSNEELKEVILANEAVRNYMERDEDIRNIMNLIQSSSIEGDLAESSRKIAHSYIFDDIPLEEQRSFSTQEIGKGTINSRTEEKDKANLRIQREQQELIQAQENQEQLE